jgi:hypothetical protein
VRPPKPVGRLKTLGEVESTPGPLQRNVLSQQKQHLYCQLFGCQRQKCLDIRDLGYQFSHWLLSPCVPRGLSFDRDTGRFPVDLSAEASRHFAAEIRGVLNPAARNPLSPAEIRVTPPTTPSPPPVTPQIYRAPRTLQSRNTRRDSSRGSAGDSLP